MRFGRVQQPREQDRDGELGDCDGDDAGNVADRDGEDGIRGLRDAEVVRVAAPALVDIDGAADGEKEAKDLL